MNQTGQASNAASQTQRSPEVESFIKAFRGIRYQVKSFSKSQIVIGFNLPAKWRFESIKRL